MTINISEFLHFLRSFKSYIIILYNNLIIKGFLNGDRYLWPISIKNKLLKPFLKHKQQEKVQKWPKKRLKSV